MSKGLVFWRKDEDGANRHLRFVISDPDVDRGCEEGASPWQKGEGRSNISRWLMKGRGQDVQETLKHPDEIRRSKSDPNMYLFYRVERSGRWICAVVKRLNGDAFLVTTYPTDALKEGERIWTS